MKTRDIGVWEYNKVWYKYIKLNYNGKEFEIKIVASNGNKSLPLINKIHRELYLWFSSNLYSILQSSEKSIREFVQKKYGINSPTMKPSGITLFGDSHVIQIFYYIEELDKDLDTKITLK